MGLLITDNIDSNLVETCAFNVNLGKNRLKTTIALFKIISVFISSDRELITSLRGKSDCLWDKPSIINGY